MSHGDELMLGSATLEILLGMVNGLSMKVIVSVVWLTRMQSSPGPSLSMTCSTSVYHVTLLWENYNSCPSLSGSAALQVIEIIVALIDTWP